MSDKKICFLPGTHNNIYKILKKYIINLKYPLNLGDEISNLKVDELSRECEFLLDNIDNEIKEMLLIKSILQKNNISFNRKLKRRMNSRLSNEISYKNDEILTKIFDNCNSEDGEERDFDEKILEEVEEKDVDINVENCHIYATELGMDILSAKRILFLINNTLKKNNTTLSINGSINILQ